MRRFMCQLVLAAVTLHPIALASSVPVRAASPVPPQPDTSAIRGSVPEGSVVGFGSDVFTAQLQQIAQRVTHHTPVQTTALLSRYQESIGRQIRPCAMTDVSDAESMAVDGYDVIVVKGSLSPLDRWVLAYDQISGRLMSATTVQVSEAADTVSVRIARDDQILVEQTTDIAQLKAYSSDANSIDDCAAQTGWSCFKCCMDEAFGVPSIIINAIALACTVVCAISLGIGC